MWRKLPSPNPLTIGLDTWVEDERIHVEYVHKAEQWNLIIDQVNAADQGDYECQVSITQRKLRQNIRLEVMGQYQSTSRTVCSGDAHSPRCSLWSRLKLVCPLDAPSVADECENEVRQARHRLTKNLEK